ncbi:MAG: DUF4153 domain-containing protein [Lachnospiraceae bacterium]
MESGKKSTLRLAALVMFVLAYWYTKEILFGSSWAMGNWQPLAFAAAFLVYLAWLIRRAPASPDGERQIKVRTSAGIAACLLLQSVAFGVFPVHDDLMGVFQVLLWHATAVFAVLAATGMLAENRLGLLFPADGLNGAVRIPFRNLFLRARILYGRWDRPDQEPAGKEGKTSRVGAVAVPILTTVIASALVVFAASELSAASTSFAAIGDRLADFFGTISMDWFLYDCLPYLILSIPVGAYLYGLVAGCLTESPKALTGKSWESGTRSLRIFPETSWNLILGALLAVYTLFFALAGGWSEIFDLAQFSAGEACGSAVSGFWQLVRVMCLNFGILFASTVFAGRPLWEQKTGRKLAAALLVFGLGFGFLAFWKLFVLYVGLFGPTPRRIFAGWVLCVLLFWDALGLLRLRKRFPASTVGIWGALVSFTILNLFPIEALCR